MRFTDAGRARPRELGRTRVLLCGAGHAHLEVLRRLRDTPDPSQQVTLVSPDAAALYSGMLPGVIAGHYPAAAAQIPLAPLARAAGAAFVPDRIAHVDLDRRIARLASGAVLAFEVLSLDVGSEPDLSLPGAREHAIRVRPFGGFVAAFDDMRRRGPHRAPRIAVVGAGAAGVELAFAIHYALTDAARGRAPSVALVSDRAAVLDGHGSAAQRRALRLLHSRRIAVHLGSAALAVTPEGVRTAAQRIAADHVVMATTAVAPAWLAGTGLACDARGFVSVDATLRSVSHPFVFAAGDCASQAGHAAPKSGVYAVREGPPLAANLRRHAAGAPLVRYHPQRRALALITTGDRHAIASRPPFAVEGDWVWRWKDRIDRHFVARYLTGG